MTWAAILKLALELMSLIGGMIRSAQDRGLGRKEAIAEALTRASADLDLANQARAEAEARHKTGTDADFDPEGARD